MTDLHKTSSHLTFTCTLLCVTWGDFGFPPAGPQRPVAGRERGANREDKATRLKRRHRSTARMRELGFREFSLLSWLCFFEFAAVGLFCKHSAYDNCSVAVLFSGCGVS